MATPFTNLTPGPESYKGILRTFGGGLTSVLSTVSDALGVDSPLSLSTVRVAISGASLQVSGVDILPSPYQINKNYRTLSDGVVEANKVIVASGNGAVNFLGYDIHNPNLFKYTIDYSNEGNIASSTKTIDLNNKGQVQRIVLANSPTLTFSTTVASGNVFNFDLIVKQDNTGGRSITWPSGVVWYHTNEPALRSAANAQNIFRFLTYDGGTTWYGHEIATDLQNVDVTSPVSGELLFFDGTGWKNASAANSDVVATSGQNLDVIYPDRLQSFAAGNCQSTTRNGLDVLAFDGASAESGLFHSVIPHNYNRGGINVQIHWVATSDTTGTVKWNVAFDRIAKNLDNIDITTFATSKTITDTTDSTLGRMTCSNIFFQHTEIDGVLPGESSRVYLQRDAPADTMTNDAQVLAIILAEAVPTGC